ncbi:MAG: hypothetical protein IKH96_09060 [Ruminococcus sp.]|uniref:hypothetical protein n=1 Tax=Ruminococcus sp. TaxID=41978 RepID=UPI0025F00C66|nr:hypothetical protein [Ruminococcus sp.]MBR6996151.1 hypothetical protein [Ruminococcus sp.]
MKKYSDEQIIQAVLSSGSQSEAARSLGLNKTTITHRMKNPDFKRKLDEAKAAYLQQAVQELRQELKNSVKTLAAVRDDATAPQSVRIQAADTILRHACKYTEIVDIVAEINKLKEQFNDV